MRGLVAVQPICARKRRGRTDGAVTLRSREFRRRVTRQRSAAASYGRMYEVSSDLASAPAVTSQEQLWRLHRAELTRFASVLVGPADAHDVVAEAFLRAAPMIVAGGVEQPRAYLFRAMTNTASGHRRSRRRRWARDLHALVPDSTPGERPDLDVQRAVAALSVGQRAVVYLAYWEDLSERAIAEVLDVSLGTVRRHLVRARTHLRKALQ